MPILVSKSKNKTDHRVILSDQMASARGCWAPTTQGANEGSVPNPKVKGLDCLLAPLLSQHTEGPSKLSPPTQVNELPTWRWRPSWPETRLASPTKQSFLGRGCGPIKALPRGQTWHELGQENAFLGFHIFWPVHRQRSSTLNKPRVRVPDLDRERHTQTFTLRTPSSHLGPGEKRKSVLQTSLPAQDGEIIAHGLDSAWQTINNVSTTASQNGRHALRTIAYTYTYKRTIHKTSHTRTPTHTHKWMCNVTIPLDIHLL